MSERKKSRYAEKKESGKQMYGPGCCAHSITMAQIEKRKAECRRDQHFLWTPGRTPETRPTNGQDYRRYGT